MYASTQQMIALKKLLRNPRCMQMLDGYNRSMMRGTRVLPRASYEYLMHRIKGCSKKAYDAHDATIPASIAVVVDPGSCTVAASPPAVKGSTLFKAIACMMKLNGLFAGETVQHASDTILTQTVTAMTESKANATARMAKAPVQYTRQFKTAYDPFSWTVYVDRMRSGSAYASTPEMHVISKLYNVRIHVYERRGTSFVKTMTVDTPRSTTFVRLIRLPGGAYAVLFKEWEERVMTANNRDNFAAAQNAARGVHRPHVPKPVLRAPVENVWKNTNKKNAATNKNAIPKSANNNDNDDDNISKNHVSFLLKRISLDAARK